MFNTYFFIPTNSKRKIQKTENLIGIDYRIFDFEDSILDEDIGTALVTLKDVNRKDTDWIRVPFEGFHSIIKESTKLGFNNFMIPKFNGYEELKKVITQIDNINIKARYILLVEQPKTLIDLEKIIINYQGSLHGIALGSHDFSFTTGIQNDIHHLKQIRIDILIMAKAYGIEPIDVVSMNLTDTNMFKEEIMDSFSSGYRSKLLIHPQQLDLIKSYPFYTLDQVNKLSEILEYYYSEVEGKKALFSLNGRVYEKMHIERIKKIVEWGVNFYGTDR